MFENNRILVIKLGALGDFFSAFAAFAAVRAHHPAAHITLMTTPAFSGIATASPYFNAVWTPGKLGTADITNWLSIFKRLRQENFSAVYDLQRNDKTKALRWMVGRQTRAFWLGGPKGGQLATLDRYRVPPGLLDTRDISRLPPADMDWIKAGTSLLPAGRRCVMLVPGSAPQHPGKRWPAMHFAALARQLIDDGCLPVLIGTADEADVTRAIKEQVPEALDLTARTSLANLAAMAGHATAAVGNDTGPMHILSLCGCPVVSLFSFLSNPAQSAPRGRDVRVLRAENMADIAVETVYRELMALPGFR